jgi:hypothetical protein
VPRASGRIGFRFITTLGCGFFNAVGLGVCPDVAVCCGFVQHPATPRVWSAGDAGEERLRQLATMPFARSSAIALDVLRSPSRPIAPSTAGVFVNWISR